MGLFSKIFGNKNSASDLAKSGFSDKLAFLEVDIHNHLLPGIDDGSKSVEDSQYLICGLQNLGFNNFICTPHIMQDVHPNTFESIDSAHKLLDKELKSNNSIVKIVPAAEHMIDEDIFSMISANSLMVMPGGYVLIEMSYLAPSRSLFQVILDIRNLGYKPILAHPERYSYYQNNVNIFKQVKDAGCALQLNLLSLTKYYGENVNVMANQLLAAGMYDFVGTDLHHERHLKSLENLVIKYPVREMLKNNNIKNAEFLDVI